MDKQQRREYNKLYYARSRGKLIEHGKLTTPCACGKLVTNYNRKRHENSIYHKKRILLSNGLNETDHMLIDLYYRHMNNASKRKIIDDMKRRLQL